MRLKRKRSGSQGRSSVGGEDVRRQRSGRSEGWRKREARGKSSKRERKMSEDVSADVGKGRKGRESREGSTG